MKRVIPTLLFAIGSLGLTGQIHTNHLPAPQGGTIAFQDVTIGQNGYVHLAYQEFVTIDPNIPLVAEVPWLSRFDSHLKLDTSAQPLDSLPITSQHLTPLKNGKILLGFTGKGFNGYNWTGYSYALLDTDYRPVVKAYDTSATERFLRHAVPTSDSNVLGIVYQYSQSDSIQLFNPYTGNTRWSIPGISSLPFALSRINGAYAFADSLRVVFSAFGVRNPCPIWKRQRYMATLNYSSGALGSFQALPDSLISVTHSNQFGEFHLLYLDSGRQNLTYEHRDSSWKALNYSQLNISNILSQSQLPAYRLFSKPHVLRKGKGIGFLVKSQGGSVDSLWYVRINPQGQLLQKARMDAAPPELSNCRSLAGPDGSYFSILKGSPDSIFIVKAQPRNRISLPASKAMSKNLQLSPLPATDQLQVKLPGATGGVSHTYRLYGLTGQMYQHGTLPFSGGEATLDINQLPSGSYILVLEAGERRYRAKVVVER